MHATNPIKLARAKGNLPADATLEQILAEYVRLGGNLVDDEEKQTVESTVKKVVAKVKKAVKKK